MDGIGERGSIPFWKTNIKYMKKEDFTIMLYGFLILHSITWMLIQQDFDNIPRIMLFVIWGLLLGLCIQKKLSY